VHGWHLQSILTQNPLQIVRPTGNVSLNPDAALNFPNAPPNGEVRVNGSQQQLPGGRSGRAFSGALTALKFLSGDFEVVPGVINRCLELQVFLIRCHKTDLEE
jgi:hypothetical protein